MATPRETDPITTAVVHNALLTTAREMRETIQRTSFSPIIYEDRDFACGLMDADANTLAEAPGLTAFMGTLSPGIKKSFEQCEKDQIEPGDIFCTSIPAFTGSHPADMMLWMPIFHEGRLEGFTCCMAHWLDVGGTLGNVTTDIFSEGIQIPILKYQREGVVNQDLIDIIAMNVRLADRALGDLRAQITAITTGERRYVELLQRRVF